MKDYDPAKPSKYLDMNNLCGQSMSSYLPYGGFKWLKDVDNFDVNSISKCNSIENNSTGYILKMNLEYPDELYTLHNDYPLAPEKLSVPYDKLLDYCKKNCEQIWNKSW